MNKVIITGGYGFIGTAIRKALSGVLLYEAVNERCEDVKGHAGSLIHLASSISERESFINPAKYINNNIKNLALLITNNNFDEIIFPSSAAVYDEKGNLEPTSVYGITKLACELLIKIYFKKYWVLRIANPLGPGDKKTVFARLAYCKLHNEVFTIYNDPDVIRDFFLVSQVGNIVQNIFQGSLSPGTYNVGSGVKILVVNFLKSICEKHNVKYTITDSPSGISQGYIATDNLLPINDKNYWAKHIRNMEEEWLKYLS